LPTKILVLSRTKKVCHFAWKKERNFGIIGTADRQQTDSRQTADRQQRMQGHSAAETQVFVPHRGSLCRFPDEHGVVFYAIEIRVVDEEQHSQQQQQQQPPLPLPLLLYNVHELIFSRHDFEFCSNLFAICDTQNRGLLDRSAVLEFATLRCPVFWRRDEDFSYQQQQQQQHAHDTTHTTNTNTNTSRTTTTTTTTTTTMTGSPTFDEIWKAVVSCSQVTPPSQQQQQQQDDDDDDDTVVNVVELGVEAWMVFCRFVCLAQYLEAKRRFSARHLQQTMRHRNAPRGSEVVVVDVPPPTYVYIIQYIITIQILFVIRFFLNERHNHSHQHIYISLHFIGRPLPLHPSACVKRNVAPVTTTATTTTTTRIVQEAVAVAALYSHCHCRNWTWIIRCWPHMNCTIAATTRTTTTTILRTMIQQVVLLLLGICAIRIKTERSGLSCLEHVVVPHPRQPPRQYHHRHQHQYHPQYHPQRWRRRLLDSCRHRLLDPAKMPAAWSLQ
jgi:hypothetical protein